MIYNIKFCLFCSGSVSEKTNDEIFFLHKETGDEGKLKFFWDNENCYIIYHSKFLDYLINIFMVHYVIGIPFNFQICYNSWFDACQVFHSLTI